MIAATTKRYLLSLAAIFVGMIMRKYMYKCEDDSDVLLLKQKYGVSETYDIITSHVIDELILEEEMQYSESEVEELELGYKDLHDLVQDDDDDDIIFDGGNDIMIDFEIDENGYVRANSHRDVEMGDFIIDEDGFIRENPNRQAS